MISLLRTCLPLAIAAVLCLPMPSADAQQGPAKPTAPPKPKHGPTPPPIACPERLAGLNAGQTESFNFWLRAQGPAEQVKIAFSCKLDRGRIVVAIRFGEQIDRNAPPPREIVYVLDLALDPPPARLLREQIIQKPNVIVRPGGGMSLVFVENAGERGMTVRAWRAVDLDSGKMQTLLSVPIETTGLGCVVARGGGFERFILSSETSLVDVGDNGPYGVSVEHEDTDCKAGKNEKRVDIFVAVPDGFEEFK